MILVAGGADAVTHRFASRLGEAGMTTVRVADGAQALVAIGKHEPTAILLSADLPVVPPITVVTTARCFTQVPILLGVGAGEAHTVGAALVAGATGLIGRPFEAGEVLSSLRQRWSSSTGMLDHRSVLTYGPIKLDPLAYRVEVDGHELSIPLKQFELLRLLMLNADHVVSLEKIREAVWGDRPARVSTNTVATHVGRLRHRLGPQVLHTVRGVGYRLSCDIQTVPA